MKQLVRILSDNSLKNTHTHIQTLSLYTYYDKYTLTYRNIHVYTDYIIYYSDSSPVSGNFGQRLRCGLLPLDQGKPGLDSENEVTGLRTVGKMVVGNTISGTYKPCITRIECS